VIQKKGRYTIAKCGSQMEIRMSLKFADIFGLFLEHRIGSESRIK